MFLRTFALGALLGLGLAMFPSCGPSMQACGPSTCSGCCSADGECVIAPSALACGGSGSMCIQCMPSQQCLFGFCTAGNGGTGGSAGTGGGAANTGGGAANTGGGAANTGGGSANTGGGGSANAGGGSANTGGGTATGGGSGTVPMRVFITSVSYVGTFGTASQADSLCTTAAQAANKGGTWKAWLSTDSVAAATRFVEVGPWYQQSSDGSTRLTFNNKANLTTTPLFGISVDEMGRLTSNSYWTGTSGGGAIGSTCASWTDGISQASYGRANQVSTSWTEYSTDYCQNAHALLCFEQSHAPLSPTPSSTRKRVFITSVSYAGTFGSAAQADTLCTTAAQAANKTGTWKAWLSTDLTEATARMAASGPWYQQATDGTMTLTFNNKANLTTTPLAGLSVDEMGRLTSNSYWTGTTGGGAVGSTCDSWTDGISQASYGRLPELARPAVLRAVRGPS
jgi:hypothetical protein